MMTTTGPGSRIIVFLGADDWVRVISLVSIIQCGAFVIGGGTVIIGRLSGYFFITLDTLYVIIVTSVSIAGLYLGIALYEGVEEKNPNKLLAWMFYACYIKFLLILNFGIYLVYFPYSLNSVNIVGLILCLLLYGVFLVLVNIHRHELLNANKRSDEVEMTCRIRSPPFTPIPREPTMYEYVDQ